ncbi:unnamed protein product [Rhizophagus irregularis]|nr:unnamed protein product [Rhizophagus irregularis]
MQISENFKNDTSIRTISKIIFPHYIINFFFCLPYFIIRNVSIFKNHLDLSLEPPETKIYLAIGALIILKFRASASAEEWISISFRI